MECFFTKYLGRASRQHNSHTACIKSTIRRQGPKTCLSRLFQNGHSNSGILNGVVLISNMILLLNIFRFKNNTTVQFLYFELSEESTERPKRESKGNGFEFELMGKFE